MARWGLRDVFFSALPVFVVRLQKNFLEDGEFENLWMAFGKVSEVVRNLAEVVWMDMVAVRKQVEVVRKDKLSERWGSR